MRHRVRPSLGSEGGRGGAGESFGSRGDPGGWGGSRGRGSHQVIEVGAEGTADGVEGEGAAAAVGGRGQEEQERHLGGHRGGSGRPEKLSRGSRRGGGGGPTYQSRAGGGRVHGGAERRAAHGDLRPLPEPPPGPPPGTPRAAAEPPPKAKAGPRREGAQETRGGSGTSWASLSLPPSLSADPRPPPPHPGDPLPNPTGGSGARDPPPGPEELWVPLPRVREGDPGVRARAGAGHPQNVYPTPPRDPRHPPKNRDMTAAAVRAVYWGGGRGLEAQCEV